MRVRGGTEEICMSTSPEDPILTTFQQQVFDEVKRMLQERHQLSSHQIAQSLGSTPPRVRRALKELDRLELIIYQAYPRRVPKIRVLTS